MRVREVRFLAVVYVGVSGVMLCRFDFEAVWGCLGEGPSTQNDLYSKRLVGKVLDPIDFTVVASMKAACGCGGIGRRTRFRFWRLWRGGSSPFTRTITDSRDCISP